MAGSQPRRASYKDVLQPALHRRFSSTATFLLAVSYLESVALSSWDSFFWAWFPIGPAGLRTLLVFLCGLAILILRIASYQVGLKTSATGWHTLTAYLLSPRTYETAFWYGVSSLLYSHIFMSTRPHDASLQWITYWTGDRARLNERALFLTFYMITFAMLQTIEHYRRDTDRLSLGSPAEKPSSKQQKNLGAQPVTFQAVAMELPTALLGCVKQAVTALPVAMFLYFFFMRSFIWSWTLMFLRPFYNLPKTNILPASWPTDISLLLRCISAGTGVGLLWVTGNKAFSVFLVMKPLKNGFPLTNEAKDPDGSLLNGMRSKKLSIKSFAMWELALVAQDFAARRQSILGDIDRKEGALWTQVYTTCIETLKVIEIQVSSYGKPSAPAAPEPAPVPERHFLSTSLRDEPIFAIRSQSSLRKGVEKAVDRLVRSPGTSPVAELRPIAKKTWQNTKDSVLSKKQQEAVSPGSLVGQVRQLVGNLLSVAWIGDLFVQDFQSQFATAVLGTQLNEPSLHANAVVALCQFAIHSLAEDLYGNVHRDVPSIIRTLTSIITKVDELRAAFPLHWTDTKGVKESPEIDQLIDIMREGLEQVLAKFEPYATDLRLSRTDIRLAKEAIARRKEEAPSTKGTEAKGMANVERKPAEERAPLPQRRPSRRGEHLRPEMAQVR
ncbi:Nuclear envelope protein ndc1 [Escovopsis weberi]|uniref:Nuclear envelope protein ndc1 n=1 Tax=Escovopsis weberi TaxID=150374 RepID=A0A0M8MYF9_ESCWE|nr:Nuclear envelope protein ndc1 [Escovopsis weberi]